MLTIGGSYITAYRQCEEDAYKQIEQFQKIRAEYEQRENHIRDIIMGSKTIAEMRKQLAIPYFYYPEFKEYPVATVREAYQRASRRIINYKPLQLWQDIDISNAKLAEAQDGELRSDIADADMPALRAFPLTDVQDSLDRGARIVASALYGLSEEVLSPRCGPQQLFNRTFYAQAVPVVEESIHRLSNEAEGNPFTGN